jgi:hypothetical protein
MATCKREGCESPTVGKSSYCATHKREAHAAWRAMVAADAERREALHAAHAALWDEVQEIGLAAGDEAGKVGTSKGDATLTVRPGNCSFAQWLVRHTPATAGRNGGVAVTVSSPDGRAERALVMARAMGRRLEAEGLRVEIGAILAV